MTYTEINARRVLARKLYEAQGNTGWVLGGEARWVELPERVRRLYERDVEKLFDLKDEETRDALKFLLDCA